MNTKLFIQAITKYVLGVLIVGGLLFIPAKSFEYWNGWLFMGLLFIPIIIGKRIKNEEKVLEKDLKGYTEYKKKVKYKVIPFVW